jgi:gamma-butyrobetaine dioxygenase/trimethyllysine dioxygenase
MPSIEPHPHFVRVHFDADRHADFHWFWLRIACPLERHPTTHEPTLCPSRVPVDVRPREARLDGETLRIHWEDAPADRPASTYSLPWLAEHAYAPSRAHVPLPPSDARHYEVRLQPGGLLPSDWAERLARDGAVLLRGDASTAHPDTTERWIEQVAAEGLRVIETHFGRIEDLRTDNTTNSNTDQLGYTDAAIGLHTDQPFLDEPPRYQLLHCIRTADVGGDSTLADARAATEWLRAHDLQAYTTLTTEPVTFHRKQRAFERVVVSPILEVRDGAFVRVRHSYFTMAPQRFPFDRMEAFHRAYTSLVRLVEANQVVTRLGPGDALLYDNHRMLHGRTGFSGPRWVRGVYFDPR